MRCARCQHEAPAGAEFCPECGARLAIACPRCSTPNAAEHKFCTKCGAALWAPVEPERAVPPSAPAAERRQLTVMFCDLVGSTALSSGLDPEEMRDVIGAYQGACTAVISRFEGHVAQYLGDGLLVYFGYPLAHEDDARRAIRAALEIVEATERLDAPRRMGAGARLAVRVGIHTGLVVVGEVGSGERHERLALGETPNLAARLQVLAAPGQVIVSGATHRLTERAFRWHDLGRQDVKGFAEPQHVWQAMGEVGGRPRTGLAGSPVLIGRDGELSLLRQRWEQARRADGQVILLTGEPGIGKSRIVETFGEEAQAQPSSALHYFCSPYYQNSALFPFVAQIERAAVLTPADSPTEKLDKLEQWLEGVGGDRQRAPLFAALLSIPFADRYAPLDLSPPALREKTFQAIEDHLARLAGAHPVFAVFEDAHWIDPTSRTMLDRLVDLVPQLPVLLVVTARPEFSASWTRLTRVTVLTLNHLGRAETAHLVAQVATGRRLSAALVDGIVERSEGIPLYAEEITKAMLEGQDDRGPDRRIPSTLRDSLTGRLDRLGWVKEIAQAAAVIGREFDEELLTSIIVLPEARRRDGLAQLVHAQIVAARRHSSRTVHYFRHALIQEAAYQSLLNATRRDYHAKIAQALETRFPERAENEPETLAQHFTEAGDDERAIAYWLRAGQRAAQRSANLESVEHLRRAQELLQKRPPGRARAEQELSILIPLGPALMATRGWNAPEVEAVYARARELAAQTGRSTDVFPAVWGRWLVAHGGGQAQLARDLLGELMELARTSEDPSLHLQVHHAGASTMCTDSNLAAATDHLETTIRLYRLDAHREQALVYGGHDPCVCVRSIGALTALMRGDLRGSRTLSDSALELAARVGHAPSVAHADWYRAELTHIQGSAGEAEARAERVFALASERGMAHYAAWALMMLGWALVKQGGVDAGLAKVEEGLAALRATGNLYHIPHRLTVRAEAFAAAGRATAARDAIEEAVESASRAGEVWYEPEALRVQAEILQSPAIANDRAAEQCLERAVATAEARGARFWKLRAGVALARLKARQNRTDIARSVLISVVPGFEHEGDVPEIAAAFELLDQLSA
jgi:class 3 adenylate cyclase/predicted ATPase